MSLSMRRYSLPVAVAVCALFVFSGVAHTQFPRLPKIPKRVLGSVPSVSTLMGSNPSVSTRLKDAKREVFFLDDFNPTKFTPMTRLKRTRDGGFEIQPGLYEFNAQSYCLHAGTYGPNASASSGSGYVYAPLRGSRADIVKRILQRSYRYPKISQGRIQFLLWAILARAKFSELRPDLRAAAAQLLGPKEIAELQTGGVQRYTDEVMDRAIGKAPRAVRQALRAEAKLRSLATDVNATFEQAERAAVLVGTPPPDKKGRVIPWGRWSLHPEGFFIRYFPYGYERTKVQIYRPSPFTMKRGPKGRIVSMAWPDGYRIEFSYNDDIEPLRIPGEKHLRGYAFRLIRFTRPDPSRRGRTQTAAIKDQGWTFVGRPSGKKRKKKRAYARPPALANIALGFWTPPPDGGFFGKITEHMDRAKAVADAAEELDAMGGRLNGDPISAEAIDALVDVGHIRDGLDVGLAGGFLGQAKWMYEHSKRQADAFRHVGCVVGGDCATADGIFIPSSPEGFEGYHEPRGEMPGWLRGEGEIAVPSHKRNQLLALSGRGT